MSNATPEPDRQDRTATSTPARVLVTGGSKGIGRAVALRMARPGARVLVNFLHDAATAERTVQELRDRGADAHTARADAGTVEGAAELAEVARERLGAVDLLVHCAVAPVSARALTIAPAEFRDAIDRNGASVLWLAQAFAELMPAGSSIVFLTSSGSRRAVPNYVGLGAAKALGEALVRYLAAELAGRGVRVNAISSGLVETDALRSVFDAEPARKMAAAAARANPSGRALTADDVAGAVAAIASADAAMVQGAVLDVDGGLGLVR